CSTRTGYSIQAKCCSYTSWSRDHAPLHVGVKLAEIIGCVGFFQLHLSALARCDVDIPVAIRCRRRVKRVLVYPFDVSPTLAFTSIGEKTSLSMVTCVMFPVSHAPQIR